MLLLPLLADAVGHLEVATVCCERRPQHSHCGSGSGYNNEDAAVGVADDAAAGVADDADAAPT